MRLPVVLWPRKSRQLTVLLCLVHAAAVAVVVSSLPTGPALGLGLVVAGSLWWQLRLPAPREIVLKADGRLILTESDGGRRDLAVEPATTVYGRLVVLRARDPDGVRTLVMPIDALGALGHRQLRVWLRWQVPNVRA